MFVISLILSIFVLHGQMQLKTFIRPVASRSCPSESLRFFAMEQWKEIPGYEGCYECSESGQIRSIENRKFGLFGKSKIPHYKTYGGNLRKQHWHDKTYYTIKLSKDNKTKTYSVHRLIALAFIPNPDSKPCINHIDGNPRNNCIDNLEWCTHSENNLHAYRTGLLKSGEEHHYAKLNDFQVRVIRKTSDISQSEIGKIFNVTQGTISNIKLFNSRKYINYEI